MFKPNEYMIFPSMEKSHSQRTQNHFFNLFFGQGPIHPELQKNNFSYVSLATKYDTHGPNRTISYS